MYRLKIFLPECSFAYLLLPKVLQNRFLFFSLTSTGKLHPSCSVKRSFFYLPYLRILKCKRFLYCASMLHCGRYKVKTHYERYCMFHSNLWRKISSFSQITLYSTAHSDSLFTTLCVFVFISISPYGLFTVE